MMETHISDIALSEAPPKRFLTREACQALLSHATRVARGGGDTWLSVQSRWTGNVRWARNKIFSSGDIRNNAVALARDIRGARSAALEVNRVDPTSLEAVVRRAERLVGMLAEEHADSPTRLPAETPLTPTIWSDVTYELDAEQRAEVLREIVAAANKEGMLSAGYLQVGAYGKTVLDSAGTSLYYPYTTAQYSVTVRDPQGTGSGWAGIDHHDWASVDVAALSAIALDKCLRSRNPARVEPGRYVTVLEPQAVSDLFGSAVEYLDREAAELKRGPYSTKENDRSKIGQRVLDPRLSITTDPMDPQLGFPPFNQKGEVFHPQTWFDHGVLKELAHNRQYAIRNLGRDNGAPNSLSYKMSGESTSLDEMVATTLRGIYVTRFSNVNVLDDESLLSTGVTRDGTWLIERGKITKPIKNLRFTESPLFAANQVEQLGTPQRVFHPGPIDGEALRPVVVPSLKVRDFNFSSLSDAV